MLYISQIDLIGILLDNFEVSLQKAQVVAIKIISADFLKEQATKANERAKDEL